MTDNPPIAWMCELRDVSRLSRSSWAVSRGSEATSETEKIIKITIEFEGYFYFFVFCNEWFYKDFWDKPDRKYYFDDFKLKILCRISFSKFGFGAYDILMLVSSQEIDPSVWKWTFPNRNKLWKKPVLITEISVSLFNWITVDFFSKNHRCSIISKDCGVNVQ